MTFEKFRLKAGILKTSIVIFGIKNTLNFKRLFSLPEEASLPRQKKNTLLLTQMIITRQFHEMLTGDVTEPRKIFLIQTMRFGGHLKVHHSF